MGTVLASQDVQYVTYVSSFSHETAMHYEL
jgi:hypothetical protein